MFMVDLKTMINKASGYPKLLQLRICLRNNQKERAREEFSPVVSGPTERLAFLFAGDRIVIPQEIKKQVVEAVHFGHLGSTKMLAECNIFWRSKMRGDIENKCSTCTACKSSSKNLKYQLPST